VIWFSRSRSPIGKLPVQPAPVSRCDLGTGPATSPSNMTIPSGPTDKNRRNRSLYLVRQREPTDCRQLYSSACLTRQRTSARAPRFHDPVETDRPQTEGVRSVEFARPTPVEAVAHKECTRSSAFCFPCCFGGLG
jgi:hypothetical protein